MAAHTSTRVESLAALHPAVVGVGAVGRLIAQLLLERGVPAERLRLFARAAREVEVSGAAFAVGEVSPEVFGGHEVVFFAGGEDKDSHFGPAAVAAGAVVIDNGDAFRLDPEVPLVIPEINAGTLDQHRGLITSPNCSAIQLCMALEPLRRLAPIRRVVVATYQAVAGKGHRAVVRLAEEVRAAAADVAPSAESPFDAPILGNLVCDWPIDAGGWTREERKLIAETRKVLEAPDLPIAATTVRVPVPYAHCQAVNIEFERPVTVAAARGALAAFPGVRVVDGFPTPQQAAGTDAVWVGRLRSDETVPHGLWLWTASDNLRKGAALNAVQIAEALARRGAFSR